MRDSLYEEIALDILVKMPVKDIVRFAMLSKAWEHLISSSRFSRRQLSQVHRNGPTYLAVFRKGTRDTSRVCYPGVSTDSFVQCLPFTHPLRTRKRLRIHGSSCGLLCISDINLSRSSSVCLWNPSICKIRPLPAPPTQPNPSFAYEVSLSFGWNPEIKDFQVIRMLLLSVPDDKYSCVVEVYSLSTQSWKIKSGFPALSGSGWTCCCCEFVNGIVCWLLENKLRYEIVSFDSASDSFVKFVVPNTIASIDIRTTVNLKVYNESMCLLVCTERDNGNIDVVLWILQQDFVNMLLRFVVTTASHGVYPLCFKRDELFMLDGSKQGSNRREMIVYNLESNQTRGTGIWVPPRSMKYHCYPHTYVESLLLLNT